MPAITDDYLTATEAAALIGCSDSLIRKRIKRGDLPAVKSGAVWRILRSDVRALDTGRDGARSAAPDAQSTDASVLRARVSELETRLEERGRTEALLQSQLTSQTDAVQALINEIQGLTLLVAQQTPALTVASDKPGWFARVFRRPAPA